MADERVENFPATASAKQRDQLALEAELEARRADVASLTAELAETN